LDQKTLIYLIIAAAVFLFAAIFWFGYILGLKRRRKKLSPEEYQLLGEEYEVKMRSLIDENDRLTNRWDSLSKLLASLGAMKNRKKMAELSSRLLMEEINADYTAVLFKEDEGLKLASAENLHVESMEKLGFPAGDPLINYVSSFPEVVVLGKWDRQFAPFKKLKEKIDEVMLMPLKVGGELQGVLWAATREGAGSFTRGEKAIMTFLGNALGYIAKNLELIEELERRAFKIVAGLAKALEQKDEYTRGHSEHVASYAVMFARRIGVAPKDVDIIRRAALLHDIGKIGIPDRVLNKPGKLTDDEYEMIKSHPIYGSELLKILGFLKDEQLLILHHHERFDGNGYPYGLSSNKIPRGSVIISLADVFDALTTDRPYRKAYSIEKALGIMEKMSGENFEPEILNEFLVFIRKRLQQQKTPDNP